MILTLFGVICLVSLIMIIIGLTRPTESAQALIGFVFLFLLSIIIINGELEYETGVNTNTTYSYDASDRINFTEQWNAYDYRKFDNSTSTKVGYYLAVASVIGFVGVLVSLRGSRKYAD